MEFICYPKCTTCQKAKKFLVSQGLDFVERHIVEDCPSQEEILGYMALYQGEAKKFFNTSGKVYRELGLKDKLKGMTKEAMAAALSEDGMLIKRPILRLDNQVLLGFKEEIWQAALVE